MGDGREQGRSPRVVCVTAPPSSFAKLTVGLAALLGPRVVPLKVRSFPLCLCFLSGLSLCASWWEPPARALGKTSTLLTGTLGRTLTSAVGGGHSAGKKLQSQEQEMRTLPLPPLPGDSGTQCPSQGNSFQAQQGQGPCLLSRVSRKWQLDTATPHWPH